MGDSGHDSKKFMAHGLEWRVSPQAKSQKESEPEKVVEATLQELKLEYKREVTTKLLKHKRALRLDFYVPQLNLAIEADGDRHFIDKKQEERDVSKDTFCHTHKISLLRLAFYSESKLMYERAGTHITQIVEEIRNGAHIMRAIGKDYANTKWAYSRYPVDYVYGGCCVMM